MRVTLPTGNGEWFIYLSFTGIRGRRRMLRSCSSLISSCKPFLLRLGWCVLVVRAAGGTVTVGNVAVPVPLPTLGLPVLAGASGEVIDSTALSFLTGRALLAQNRKEVEAQTVVEEHFLRTSGEPPPGSSSSKRKRKKRWKKRLPRSPHVPRQG